MSQFFSRGACAVVFGAVALLAASPATRADEPKPVTLAPVSVVPEVDFAKHPPLGAPILSPDGKFMALVVTVTEKSEQSYQLAVLHLPNLEFVSRLNMAPHYLPIDINWVDNKRIVMGVGRETAFSESPSPTGDIIAVDIDGKNKRLLYSNRYRGTAGAQLNLIKIPIGFGTISGTPIKANGHFYLTVNPAPETGGSEAQAHRTMIFDIDAENGTVTEMGSINADGYYFLVHDGVARYAFGLDNTLREHVYQRADKAASWNELPSEMTGKYFAPIFLSPDGKKLYSIRSPEGKPNEFAVSDLDGRNEKVLASNIRADIVDIFRSAPPRTPYAAVAFDGKPVLYYLGMV